MYKDKVILVTGGTGSWGQELVKQLLQKKPKEIRVFSRGEQAQVAMARKFNDPVIRFIIGDVRDLGALLSATKDVDYIFHLAALKHVPICEEQPQEAVKTNIVGTQNVIQASIINNVKKVIDVSTDKAVEALNLYGMTKGVGERLIIQANQQTDNTKFVCIRAGNVLGSNGSVVPFFVNQIKNEHIVTITHNEMTRYFITIPEAISLLFEAAECSYGGEIFIMKMPAYRIRDIATVMIQESKQQGISMIEIGMRAGEKLHEVLVSEDEARHTFQYSDNYYLIMPTININGIKEFYMNKKLEPAGFNRYTSNDKVLNIQEAKRVLEKSGFLKQL